MALWILVILDHSDNVSQSCMLICSKNDSSFANDFVEYH